MPIVEGKNISTYHKKPFVETLTITKVLSGKQRTPQINIETSILRMLNQSGDLQVMLQDKEIEDCGVNIQGAPT